MPLQGTTREIRGRKWVIGALPVDVAFDVGCRVMEWRGQILAAAGPAAADSRTLADIADGDEARARALIGSQVQAMGAIQSLTGKMLRDAEYRREVWARCLQVCLCDGRPVVDGSGKFLLEAADLPDAVEAHHAVIDHNCAPFLQALGTGSPSASASQPT